MATTRFGYLDDLSLKNEKVGIGTSTANERLEVLGETRGGGAVVAGIATLTSYSGFDNTKFTTTENINVVGGESGTLSGEVVIGAGTTLIVGTGATTGQGNIKSLKVSNTFIPPKGGTVDRPTAPKPGALFYNIDFRTIEYWDGNFWRQVDNVTGSGRAIYCGGSYSTPSVDINTTIAAVNIPSGGNSYAFGELMTALRQTSCCSSRVRGLTWGGQGSPSQVNEISYFNVATQSNSVDFGDMDAACNTAQALSSSTRGISYGRGEPASNVIQYVEISTKGNATDFGDCYAATRAGDAFASPTRGVLAGGTNPSTPGRLKKVEYITISSKGNGTFFGDLTNGRRGVAACSNTTRGIVCGGYYGDGSPWARIDTIDAITISSTGNATDFGDLTDIMTDSAAGSSPTRAVIAGGNNNTVAGGYFSRVQSIEFSSKGNAVNFGEMSSMMKQAGGCSDCHGGLGGF